MSNDPQQEKGQQGDSSTLDAPHQSQGVAKRAALAVEGWIASAFSDWLCLLTGPQCPMFEQAVTSNDWTRLFRLLVLTVFISGIFLTFFSVDPQSLSLDLKTIALTSAPAMWTLIGAAGFAVIYRAFAWIWRIPITLPESFFTILFLGLPWLPLLSIIEAVKYKAAIIPLAGIIYGYGMFFFLGAAIFNFARGIRQISKCPAWKVWMSVIVPVVLVIILSFQ
jgi:hypothetical protein